MRWPTFGSMKWVMRHRTKEMRAGSRLFGLPLLLFLCLFCFELNSILYLGGVCVLVCYRMYSRVPCLSLCFVLRVFFALCLSTRFCFLCFLVYLETPLASKFWCCSSKTVFWAFMPEIFGVRRFHQKWYHFTFSMFPHHYHSFSQYWLDNFFRVDRP